MTDDEIRAEIARQVQQALAQLAVAIRARCEKGGPVSRKAINSIADAVHEVLDGRSGTTEVVRN